MSGCGGTRDPSISKGRDSGLRGRASRSEMGRGVQSLGPCGKGLRGFESHPPHFTVNPPLTAILSYAFWMKKQGYKESTIRPSVRALKAIAKRTDLLDPEKVKEYLAYANVSENRKNKLSDDLARFYRCLNISFDRPRYRKVQRLPFIPLEQEIVALISGVGRKTAAFLQLLKETGAGRLSKRCWKNAVTIVTWRARPFCVCAAQQMLSSCTGHGNMNSLKRKIQGGS